MFEYVQSELFSIVCGVVYCTGLSCWAVVLEYRKLVEADHISEAPSVHDISTTTREH